MTQLDNSNVDFSVIHDFGATFADGNNPDGRLIVDASGSLYGVTLYGGQDIDDDGNGLVFLLEKGAGPGGTYKYTILHTFTGGPTDGERPVGGLLRDATGSLYGTTGAGGSGYAGTVFKLTAKGGIGGGYGITYLYQFSSNSGGSNWDGAGPDSHLIMDSTGTLFGTTSVGGANGGGTVFKLTPQAGGSYAFANLHNFGAPTGYNDTSGGLVMDSSGNLYGLKAGGGTYGAGDLYALNRQGDGTYAYASLYSFPLIQAVDPQWPFGTLALDGSGNLFGTTWRGGPTSSGTVFKYTIGTSTLTTLYDFGASGGSSPLAGVVLDKAGNLYGTTDESSPGYGAVYKLKNNGNGTYTYGTVFEFTKGMRQGRNPDNTLVTDSFGHLLGTAANGGKYNGGTVFRIGETAQAIAVMEVGSVPQVVVINPGRGYAAPPTVTITPSGNGMTAQAVATVANGSVTAVKVTNQGSGYDFGPQVFFSAPDP